MNNVEKLQKLIDESDNIVFFGGAGVSTASGIKDFRGKNGLYKEKDYPTDLPPEYMLSIDLFMSNPEMFYSFYKDKMNCLDKEPNIVHKYLAKLEKENKLKAIITQNIDGLHQKAGSKNVLEIHGTVYNNHCISCGKSYSAEYVFNSDGVPRCSCSGIIKPDVVLYGEQLPSCFMKAIEYINKADLLIVAGTSLTVEPAASLVRMFDGKHLVIMNGSLTAYESKAELAIHDRLEDVFSNLK